jgi:hypothetical protein
VLEEKVHQRTEKESELITACVKESHARSGKEPLESIMLKQLSMLKQH